MVTLTGSTRTFVVTSDLYAVYLMKRCNQRRSIEFKNGFRFNLVWSQFRTVRDSYHLLKRYAIEQLGDDVFRMRAEGKSYWGTLVSIAAIGHLLQKYAVKQLGDNSFRIWNDRIRLMGSEGILYSISEIESGIYDCACSGKSVLDVGGFEGESAVYFSSLGASKVIVYEPVIAHHKFIVQNTSTNRVNAEIHMAGVGFDDGTQTIHYTDTSLGFGVLDKGEHELEIELVNVSKVINESGADIAKFDCEGAEECLLQVQGETLRKIEFYIIEVHTPAIRKEIKKKFKNSGFRLINENMRDACMSVLYFRRNYDYG